MTKQWTPVPWLWRQHRINAAWYSGDPEMLAGNTEGFWRTDEPHKAHVGIAADIAALMAGMLFCGSPVLEYGDGATNAADEATNARLAEIAERNGLYARLLEAAELASVYGGVGAKWNWDVKRAGYPILRFVPGDAVLPQYVNGLLDSVAFWSVQRATDDGKTLWRLEEVYTSDGRIKSRLYEGSPELLGHEVPLSSIPETESVKPDVQSGTGMLLAAYIPNRLPNRLHPYAPYGRSDFDGLHTLFSALDEAYSSMSRDVRLGKTQIIVPAEYLRQDVRDLMFAAQVDDKNIKWTFSKSEEAYVALNFSPDSESGQNIVTFQPAIRAEDHIKVVDDLVRRILMLSGLAPQSAGIDVNGSAESGTALNVRERRSMQTAEAKKTYWWHGLIDIFRAGLALDKALFNNALSIDGELSVSFADNTSPDMATVAETLAKLAQAGAASTERKVRILNPDMSDDEVSEEVARIHNEDGIPSPLDPPDPALGDAERDPPGGDGA